MKHIATILLFACIATTTPSPEQIKQLQQDDLTAKMALVKLMQQR